MYFWEILAPNDVYYYYYFYYYRYYSNSYYYFITNFNKTLSQFNRWRHI